MAKSTDLPITLAMDASLARSPRSEAGGLSVRACTETGGMRIAIVGAPDSGKSTLHARLSGRASAGEPTPGVPNVAEATIALEGRPVVLIDTPGICGLECCGEDELPTRELLCREPPDVIVQCLDATSLVRSLVLTDELAELAIPMVLCVNLFDEAIEQGTLVDAEALAKALGVPVIATCARDGRGVAGILPALPLARRPRTVSLPSPAAGAPCRGHGPRGAACAEHLASTHPGLRPGRSARRIIEEERRHWALELARTVTRQTGLAPKPLVRDALARWALHPIGAWGFLLTTLVVAYLLVAKVGVGILAAGMERFIAQPITERLGAYLGAGPWRDVLIGPYGLITAGVFNAVCTVLPILLVFYFVYSFLEEANYFPYLSVQFDRLLRTIGLTGKAVLPFTLGFGCNSAATVATSRLESGSQRLIACLLIALGVPCAVQLGVIIAILSTLPLAALLIYVGIILVVQVVVGRALALLLPRGEQGELLLEIPRLRLPQPGQLLRRTVQRVRQFLVEAVPMFLLAAGIMVSLERLGLLERIRRLLAPFVASGLGLPESYADMLLPMLARREVGAVMLKNFVDAGTLDHRQVVVALTVMTLFVPCVNNALLLGRVLGWLRATAIFAGVLVIGFGVGMAVNWAWQ
jgi:ferrous iron transport protein B